MMASPALDQALDNLDRAAEGVREAASAPGMAEGVSAAVHAATGIDPFIFQLAIFVLAIFVGYYVVWSVTPALHTPLMAVTTRSRRSSSSARCSLSASRPAAWRPVSASSPWCSPR
jgi:NAD/NADP transhydrogenase alpha subunit